jgi:hypothetical protein
MTPIDFLWGTAPFIAGWVWKVEQRLMRLGDIEADVKDTKQDVKAIYNHLIGARDVQADDKARS